MRWSIDLLKSPIVRRVLFATHHCYLDDSNGAAVASRDLMQALARRGLAVEVLCGSMLDLKQEVEPAAWLAGRRFAFEEVCGQARIVDARGVRDDVPPHFRLTVQGVPITLHQGPTTKPHEPDDDECRSFLHLFEAVMKRFRPEVVVGYGGNRLQRSVFARAKARGAATVFDLHNFQYTSTRPFADVDVVRVPSQFAADAYRTTLGLECRVLSNVVDPNRVWVEQYEPKYVTFVNPSPEKGVYAFARIADNPPERLRGAAAWKSTTGRGCASSTTAASTASG